MQLFLAATLVVGCVTPVNVDIDADQDGLLTSQEEKAGTDPFNEDSDGDGFADGLEVDSGRDPLDAESKPYTGGWKTDSCANDIASTGSAVGDVGADFELMDQFGETVRLYDFCAHTIYIVFGAFW
jgi:Bacterial TSP3 repeat